MKNNNTKKFKKKLKYKNKEKPVERRRFSVKKKEIQVPNFLLAERILKGTVSLEALRDVQNKKILRSLQGRYSDVSIEKFIMKNVKEGKRQRMKKIKEASKEGKDNAERMAYFKLKKEPEKNKTHWDHVLEEMKWMQNDFDKERKLKKKKGMDMSKFAKKFLDTRHLEVEKKAKRMEQELKKISQQMGRSVNVYWKKIEKLTKHHYNVMLQENKMQQQQNRLLGFINKLQKISGRVADSLPSKNLLSGGAGGNQSVLSIGQTQTMTEKSSVNENDEDFNILLKKNEDGTYSVLENNEDENMLAQAAHIAEEFQPKGTDLSQAQIHLEQPFLLKHALREYQLIGLHWLIALHDNKINGILADEMGLGKTIQTISLLAYLAGKRGNWGPHLIIVPTTIIINWEIEFKKWCPGLKILSYYGNQKERKAKRHGWHRPNAFNVCITSYKLVIQDYSIFKRKRWYYIVLDEAQNIKNFKSKRWQMLLNFKAKRKLLLTGTPLQNDVMEIWSYLHFLMPNLFYSNEEFRDWFYSQFYNAIHNNAALNKKMIQSLHSILRPFLLRRLKKDVEKQLPEKIEHIVYCDLTRRQKYLYDEYINSDKTQDTLKLNDYFSIMNVLMQLRKVCNHPDLFDTRDYVTPSKQLWEISYYVPSSVLNILAYNPLKTINYKNLNLILEDNEKLSKYEYFTALRNFPSRPLYDIYNELITKERMLFTPKYLIDENDILFKRQYCDATILYPSNTEELRSMIDKGLTSSGNLPNTNPGLNLNNNLPMPKYICPSNIPLLRNTSISNYFDILYPVDTLNFKDQQDYLRSVFHDNIKQMNTLKREEKKKLLHTYDLLSRKNIIFKKPVYGLDAVKHGKINLAIPNVHNSAMKIVYGSKSVLGNRIAEWSVVNSQILNKGYKYWLSNLDEILYLRPKLNNTTLEGIYIREEETEVKKEEEDINKEKDEIMDIEIEISEENKEREDKIKINTEEDEKKKIDIPFITKVKSDFVDFPCTSNESIHFLNTDAMHEMVMTPQKMLNLCEDIMSNFRIHIPQLICSGPQLIPSRITSAHTQTKNHYRMLYNNLNRIPNVQKYFSLFKTISFPDKKLVEFDSGKLIKLAQLLKKLKANKSKVLIFTQMTRMLDILERFLNLHDYTYVRLDGSTKVEVRQQVVDKFNNDPRVFCFISSTRSGGIGLNLTGADSIVFYDTDWNPAMDKQAQDRCHRIGQTRTVHIYRLITLSTIEENIFRKSIQKRELNYVIMEDGKFDMNNFRKINLKSIVEEENLVRESNSEDVKMAEAPRKDDKLKKLLEFENLAFDNEEEQRNIEQMLIRIEDQEDVQALKNLSKEMLDEYEKENNELQYIQNEDENTKEKGDTKDILKDPKLLSSLKGIDKFALRFYQNQYTYEDFIQEKESRSNLVYFPSPDQSDENLDEDLDIGPSEDEEERQNKLDLDQAYEMYLNKKKDILRSFELMAGLSQSQQANTSNINE